MLEQALPTTPSPSIGVWYWRKLTRHYVALEQAYISTLNNEELRHIIRALIGFALLNATMSIILPEIAQAMLCCFLFAVLLAPILYTQRDLIEKWEKGQTQMDDRILTNLPEFTVRHIIGFLVNEEGAFIGLHSLAAEKSLENVLKLSAVCPTWAQTMDFALGTRREQLLARWRALSFYNSERKAEGQMLAMCRLDQFGKVLPPKANHIARVKEFQEKTVAAMKASQEPWWITVDSVKIFFHLDDFERALEGVELDEDEIEPLKELEWVADKLSQIGSWEDDCSSRKIQQRHIIQELNSSRDATRWQRCGSDALHEGRGEGVELYQSRTIAEQQQQPLNEEQQATVAEAHATDEEQNTLYELPVPISECSLENYLGLVQQQCPHHCKKLCVLPEDCECGEFTVCTHIDFAYAHSDAQNDRVADRNELKLGCKVIVSNNTGQWLEIAGWFNDFDFEAPQRFEAGAEPEAEASAGFAAESTSTSNTATTQQAGGA